MPENTVTFLLVVGHPAYRVGDDGSVWSRHSYNGKGPLRETWTQLKPAKNVKTGRLSIYLCSEGKGVWRYVHHLVLEAFVGPCPPGGQCRHFPDPSPENNRLENIQWGTQKENEADKIVHGTKQLGETCTWAKLTEAIVRSIREECANGVQQKELAKKHGLTTAMVCMIVNRKRWKHVE
jgi:hypothetical protein